MKNKNDNNILIIFAIFCFIVLISFLIYFNIKWTTIINIIIILIVLGLMLYIPFIIAQKKEQSVNELFILDIFRRYNNDEHIRITEKRILFKYKNVIKYYYVFPKLFSFISLNGKIWETPTYNVIGKIQLSVDELNHIIEKIIELNSDIDGDIIVNYKGNKKFVNSKDINKIFKNYSIRI